MVAMKQGDGVAKWNRFEHWLRIDPHAKPKVYAQVYATAEISSFSYWLEIIFSAGIAAIGLVLNSPAVIIGAMLISPLMGPIMATGLAIAAGDLYLALKALANLVISISLAIALSGFIVWLLPFHSATNEILSRTNPNLLDLGVALFSGLAGSVAVCRTGGTDSVTTLPGVAIAVALMPPLCTIGFGLGSGWNTRIMSGASLLFLTNLVAIVSSAFVVFVLVGMNSSDIRLEMEHSRGGERFAQKLMSGRLSRLLTNGGQLHWRILMLVVLLGAVAVPLRTALLQVASETAARGAVQDVVKNLIPPGALVSQQVEVGRENIAIRVVSTQSVPDDKVRESERVIERRSGRKVELSVSSVASQSELARLMQKIAAPPLPVAPTIKSLDQIHDDLIARVQPALSAIWPTETPLQDFDLSFSAENIVLNARYQSDRELDTISLNLIQQELRDKLATPNLALNAHRTSAIAKSGRQAAKKVQ